MTLLSESIVRNVKKDTGLKIENFALCDARDWIDFFGIRHIDFYYVINKFSGNIKSLGSMECFFANIKDLNTLDFSSEMKTAADVYTKFKFDEMIKKYHN